MKKRIEFRTNYADWYASHARVAEAKVSQARRRLDEEYDNDRRTELLQIIREQTALAANWRNEERRYRLIAHVCKNEVLAYSPF